MLKKQYLINYHNLWTNGCFPNFNTLFPNKVYFYDIPKDIIPYIEYRKNEFIIKTNIPENLKEKVWKCKAFLQIEMDYMFKYRKMSRLGGEMLGIENKILRNTLIMFQVSDPNYIGINNKYEDISKRLEKRGF